MNLEERIIISAHHARSSGWETLSSNLHDHLPVRLFDRIRLHNQLPRLLFVLLRDINKVTHEHLILRTHYIAKRSLTGAYQLKTSIVIVTIHDLEL